MKNKGILNRKNLKNKQKERIKILENMCSLIPKDLPQEIQIRLRNQVLNQGEQKQTRLQLIQILKQIKSNDIVELYTIFQEFRRFIGSNLEEEEKEKQIDFFLNLKIVQELVAIIKHENQCPLIIFEAVWIIVNITSGNSRQLQEIVNIELFHILYDQVQNEKHMIQEVAIWAVGNIAADCSQYKDQLLEQGFLKLLIKGTLDQYERESKFSGIYVWALSNLCRGQIQAKLEVIQYIEQAVDVLSIIIQNSNEQSILEDTCWALKAISHNQQNIQPIINSGVIPQLIKLLDNSIQQLQIIILSIIGNILIGNDQQVDYILIQSIQIDKLLQNKNKEFIKQVFQIIYQVCWCISNIVAGNIQQVHRIIYNQKIMNVLIKFIHHSCEDIQNEIVWILSNTISKCTVKDAQYLVNQGMPDWLSKLLYLNKVQSIFTVLIGIMILLSQGENLKNENNEKNQFLEEFMKIYYFQNRIKQLADNSDQNISTKAKEILEFIQK